MDITRLLEFETHILNFFVVLFVLIGAYFFVISVFTRHKKENCNAYQAPGNSFALVVSAHNEEAVIAKLVENLRQLRYPEELFDIYVIADNCKDGTADAARQAGAFVYERFNDTAVGKGYALKWMFNILFKQEKAYDAVCIFDADNLVALDFLREMDKKLKEGYEVVQGYRDIKNPYDTWITYSYSITYWLANRLFQLPRFNLGISNVLTGSGFALRMGTLKETGWEIESLTEDIEYSLQLVLKGKRIAWCHSAVVYDEQPLTLSQSWSQRKRWMQGHTYCAAKYLKPVWLRFLSKRSLNAFDSLVLLVYPFLMAIGSMVLTLNFVSDLLQKTSNLKAFIGIYAGMSFLAFILQNAYFIFFLIIERKLSLKALKGLLFYPVFGLTWIPIIFMGFFTRNQKHWAHIPHTKGIGINEIRH